MRTLREGAAAVAIATCLMAGGQVVAQETVQEFYRGQTINLIIGFGAGGGYDSYARLLAQHLGNHIPGNPTIVPQNMPGAGAIVATNHLYNNAPKDGTTIGMVAASALMQPLFDSDQAQFDASEFGWLGSMDQSIAFCGVATASGIESFDEWLESGQELAFGASGPAANTFQHPMALKNVLDVNARVVPGYAGTNEVALALERGEMDGLCGMQVTSIQSSFQHLIDNGVMTLIIQMGPEKTDVLGDIPSVYDYVENEAEGQIMDLVFGQLKLARPVLAPPGVPEERLEALREAFKATLEDPEFLAEAESAGLIINYVSASEARDLLVQFADFPKEVIDLAARAITADP